MSPTFNPLEFVQYLEVLPDFKTYSYQLNKLLNMYLSTASYEEITDAYFKNAILISFPLFKFDAHTMHQWNMYRVRLNMGSKENLSLIRAYSYPNTNICTYNGRLNLAESTVFYSTTHPQGAIDECKMKKGDAGFMSVWAYTSNRDFIAIPLINLDLPLENVWRITAINVFKFIEEICKTYGSQKFEQYKVLINLLSNVMMKEKPPYPLSSWVANQLLQHPTNECDALIEFI